MTYFQLSSLRRNQYARTLSLPSRRDRLASQNSAKNENSKTSLHYLIIILILVCLLIVIYLLQVSTTNGYSYIINDLDQRQQSLNQQVEQMELESLKLQSNQYLNDSQQQGGETGLGLPTSEQLLILD